MNIFRFFSPRYLARYIERQCVFYCLDGPDVPDPDPAIGAAAQDNVALGREALDFYKKKYDESQPARDRAASIANAVAEEQLAASRENRDISRDYWNYQKGTFRPLEQQIVADAQNYDTPERRNKAAGEAAGVVGARFGSARDTMLRESIARGINPDSGAFASNLRKMAVMEGAASAAEQNKARANVETQGYARKMDAASLGRNLPGNQATSASIAANTGSAAAQNAMMPVAMAQQAARGVGQGYDTAIGANNSAASILNQQYQTGVAAANANANNSFNLFNAAAQIGGLLV